MRPIINTKDNDTKAPSSHEKKIQKRVEKFMETVEALKFSQTGKLTILKFLVDKSAVVLSNTKAGEKFNDKFHHFTEEMDLAVRKSKKEENQKEFLELLQERIARDALGKYYKEYAAMKNSGASAAELIEWISDKQKIINPPKIRQRSHSQPTMLVSAPIQAQTPPITTAAPAANLPSTVPGLTVTQPMAQSPMQQISPVIMHQPITYPAPYPIAYPVGYAFATPAPVQHFAYPPTPQPFSYPASPNPVSYPATPPAMGFQQPINITGMTHQPYPQTFAHAQDQQPGTPFNMPAPAQAAFNASGSLNPIQDQARDQLVQIFHEAKFNRPGTLTLLKFLVNGEKPTYSEKPEVKRFNDKLDKFIGSYEQIRTSIGEQRDTRWAFECICLIAKKNLQHAELSILMKKLISEDRQSVVSWLNTLYQV